MGAVEIHYTSNRLGDQSLILFHQDNFSNQIVQILKAVFFLKKDMSNKFSSQIVQILKVGFFFR